MSRLLWILILTPLALALLAPYEEARTPSLWLGVSDDPKLDPLMAAIELRDEQTLRRLLRDPAIDPNARDREGYTPLTRAARAGWVDGVRLLLDRGADATAAIDFYGETSLHRAVYARGDAASQMVDLLIRHGANVNARCRSRRTPLVDAVYMRRTDLVQQLLRAGAEVNVADCHGFTALHCAAAIDEAGAVATLLLAGADPRARDDAGATPLDVARERGATSVVALLSPCDESYHREK